MGPVKPELVLLDQNFTLISLYSLDINTKIQKYKIWKYKEKENRK